MENIVNEIEKLLWASECKKVTALVTVLFSRSTKPAKALELLYETSKKLISQKYIREALSLLVSLKTYSLSLGQVVLLTDIKNLLSYCYRLKKRFPEAIQECKDSINICKTKSELCMRLPVLHLNLSAMYREDLKNYLRAKFHAENAYEISKKLLTIEPENLQYSRHLAVSVLTLGQIEECLQNKEYAVMWYSEGIEMSNIDGEMVDLFRNRLYGVAQKPSPERNKQRPSANSRNEGNLRKHKSKVRSRMYSAQFYDTVSSSFSVSSQFSLRNSKKVASLAEKTAKATKIQAWARMLSQKKEYQQNRILYDYFTFCKKKIGDRLFFVSIFRNITMQKHRFLRRKINSVIYIEAVALDRPGKTLTLCCDLTHLCELIHIQSNESTLKNHLGLILSRLSISNNKLCIS